MKIFLKNHLSDALILAGCGLVIYATWMLSLIAALFVTGGILIALGVLIGIGGRANVAPISEVKNDH